jgi:hypothetical protein
MTDGEMAIAHYEFFCSHIIGEAGITPTIQVLSVIAILSAGATPPID